MPGQMFGNTGLACPYSQDFLGTIGGGQLKDEGIGLFGTKVLPKMGR